MKWIKLNRDASFPEGYVVFKLNIHGGIERLETLNMPKNIDYLERLISYSDSGDIYYFQLPSLHQDNDGSIEYKQPDKKVKVKIVNYDDRGRRRTITIDTSGKLVCSQWISIHEIED